MYCLLYNFLKINIVLYSSTVVGRQEYSQEEFNSSIYISLESPIYCISNNIESPVHIYKSIYILSARLHYIRLNMRSHRSTIYIYISDERGAC